MWPRFRVMARCPAWQGAPARPGNNDDAKKKDSSAQLSSTQLRVMISNSKYIIIWRTLVGRRGEDEMRHCNMLTARHVGVGGRDHETAHTLTLAGDVAIQYVVFLKRSPRCVHQMERIMPPCHHIRRRRAMQSAVWLQHDSTSDTERP